VERWRVEGVTGNWIVRQEPSRLRVVVARAEVEEIALLVVEMAGIRERRVARISE
jgi:hypothetical protein